jgi:putative transposase
MTPTVWTRRVSSLSRPLDISEEDWSEAVHREGQVRPLAAAATNGSAVVRSAAAAIGLSTVRVYRLIRQFRRRLVRASLIVTKPGPKSGACLLDATVDRKIEDAIDSVFKIRKRPSMAKLRRDVRTDCSAAGLKVPSRKAIHARVPRGRWKTSRAR